MRYSPESLTAFVAAANAGSFSAAARQLRKSQSTVSAAIANLETDLGLILFDRSGHQPVLTPAGRKVLVHVQAILAASDSLDEIAIRLADNVEPRLSIVLSDMWKTTHYSLFLRQFSQSFPDIELESLIAEDDDVIELLRSQRAHVGVIRAQENYPSFITASRLRLKTEMAVFVSTDHALAAKINMIYGQLATTRQLCLNTYERNERLQAEGAVWSAPSYLMLLEMAIQGFGWSILPRWLVEEFGRGLLVELPFPGWPQLIDIDVVWSKQHPPGPAGFWMIDHLLLQQETPSSDP